MFTTRSIVPYSLTGLCVGISPRSQVSTGPNSRSLLATSKLKHKCQFLGNQRLEISRTSLELQHARNTKMYTHFHLQEFSFWYDYGKAFCSSQFFVNVLIGAGTWLFSVVLNLVFPFLLIFLQNLGKFDLLPLLIFCSLFSACAII